jgi:hypothetical protein
MAPPVTTATRGEVEYAFVTEKFALLVSDADDLIKFFSEAIALCDSLLTAHQGLCQNKSLNTQISLICITNNYILCYGVVLEDDIKVKGHGLQNKAFSHIHV